MVRISAGEQKISWFRCKLCCSSYVPGIVTQSHGPAGFHLLMYGRRILLCVSQTESNRYAPPWSTPRLSVTARQQPQKKICVRAPLLVRKPLANFGSCHRSRRKTAAPESCLRSCLQKTSYMDVAKTAKMAAANFCFDNLFVQKMLSRRISFARRIGVTQGVTGRTHLLTELLFWRVSQSVDLYFCSHDWKRVWVNVC